MVPSNAEKTEPGQGRSGARAAKKRAHALTDPQVNLSSVIGLIERIVEMNDLYTADHQRRVARLAIAIAQEMGLSQSQLDAVHAAAAIHDVGKVYMPDDILNKPGNLEEDELRVARNHAQAGHYMLEGVEFPWPVATIVLQHHELMDGSGYPQGLRGDEILLEARVLAVADVVEAMASPRPQRAALGIDDALKEVLDKRGTLYDPAVVDACIRLFTERSFSLP